MCSVTHKCQSPQDRLLCYRYNRVKTSTGGCDGKSMTYCDIFGNFVHIWGIEATDTTTLLLGSNIHHPKTENCALYEKTLDTTW